MDRGSFITFEGGEGAGKSTQIRLLENSLSAKGKKVVVVREPGGTPLAEKVRYLLKEFPDDPPSAKAELLLFLAARAQLVEKTIAPALAAGAWVLSDRFSDSTFAYQGFGRGLPLETIKEIDSFACAGLEPDMTFFLDLPASVAEGRMRRREASTGVAADRFERAEGGFHDRVREGFRALAAAAPERIVTIDASAAPEVVAERISETLSLRGMI